MLGDGVFDVVKLRLIVVEQVELILLRADGTLETAQWIVVEDVLNALGPPSQLIALQDETVYYYMLEEARTKIMILILYNQARARVNYDRAMFIFDKQGLLTKYSLSRPPADFKKK